MELLMLWLAVMFMLAVGIWCLTRWNKKPCPKCGEYVPKYATKCYHCSSEI